jgi:hypothetical protein
VSHDQQILAGHCTAAVALPAPRVPISVRPATMQDLPFLDSLQKQHNKALGFFPRAQMEGYVSNGWVLIAEDAATKQPLGYCASRDRYLKRDELGIIYQLCVSPGAQRKLVGAMLVREVFARSAYGCRLYCCWCAQDLEANHFWESMGFAPIAFRAGGKTLRRRSGQARVHIFWQKRIVEGDTETKWWYPSQTNQGAIREDRLVFPIPPGVHWKDVQAVVVPTDKPKLPASGGRNPNEAGIPKSRLMKGPLPPTRRYVQFGPPGAMPVVGPVVVENVSRPDKVEPKPKREKAKIDPKLVSAARELRDRYLEQVNATPLLSQGKYDVSRALSDGPSPTTTPAPVALITPPAALLPPAAEAA